MKKKTLVVIIVVAVLLIVGIAAGVISSCLLEQGAVVSLKGRHIGEDVYAYWQVRFSYAYRTLYGGGAHDTNAFWDSIPEGGTQTHRDLCQTYVDNMVEQILVASYLFDTKGYRLNNTQTESIRAAVAQATGGYRFDGDPEGYATLAKTYGFTTRSVQEALVYETKANLLRARAEADDAQILAYYQTHFVRVAHLFIRTEGLTDWRLEEKETKYQTVLSALETGFAEGATQEAKETLFASLMKEYNEDTAASTYQWGYFFGREASFTADFAKSMPQVTEAVFSIETSGAYVVVKDNLGYHILYRYDLDATSLTKEENKVFFSDLADDAAVYYMMKWIEENAKDVVWQDTPALPLGRGDSRQYLLIIDPPPAV